MIERGNPLFALGQEPSRHVSDSTNFNVEDETNHDRTVKPVVCRGAHHEQSMLNEVDIDFRIPGLPHCVVKQLRTVVFVNSLRRWTGGWGPKGRSSTGGGRLARVPNLRVCKHL